MLSGWRLLLVVLVAAVAQVGAFAAEPQPPGLPNAGNVIVRPARSSPPICPIFASYNSTLNACSSMASGEACPAGSNDPMHDSVYLFYGCCPTGSTVLPQDSTGAFSCAAPGPNGTAAFAVVLYVSDAPTLWAIAAWTLCLRARA